VLNLNSMILRITLFSNDGQHLQLSIFDNIVAIDVIYFSISDTVGGVIRLFWPKTLNFKMSLCV